MVQALASDTKEQLINVVAELSTDHAAEVLDFALFVKSRHEGEVGQEVAQPVQRLEDLWGDFWPEDLE